MKIGEIAALFTALCWTINGLLLNSVGRRIGTKPTNFYRLFFAFIFICIYTYFSRGLLLPTDAGIKTLTFLSISGIIGFAIGDNFLISSTILAGPRISMLLMAVSPIITSILDFIIFRSSLSGVAFIGITLTLFGIAVVILFNNKNSDEEKRIDVKKGIIAGIISSFFNSVGLIFSKLGMGDYNAFAATQIRIISSLLFMIIAYYLGSKKEKIFVPLEKKDSVKMMFSGILGPFVGVGLALFSLQHTNAGISATLTSVTPIMVLPFSIFLYKEKIGIGEIIGTIMSVVGISILFLF